MGERKINFIPYILIFLVVFNPPLHKGISFTTIAVLAAISVCALCSKVLFRILNDFTIKSFLVLCIVFALWCIISGLVNCISSSETSTILTNAISTCFYLCCAIIVSLGLTIYFHRKNYSLGNVIDIYIYVGVIQAVISLMCLFVPAVKSFLNDWTVQNSNSPALVRAFIMNSYRRNYGFASSLFDIFGCTMSIIAVLTFARAINGKPRYLIYYGMICIAAILNARTSIILIAAGTAIVFFSIHGRQIKKSIFLTKLLVVMVGICAFIILASLLMTSGSDNTQWLKDGLNEISSMAQGKKTGYFEILFNNFLFFPSLIESIAGTGLLPEQAIAKGSDVGYVQNIWQFGMVGSVLLYLAYFQLFRKARLNTKNVYPGMAAALFAMVALYMIKLNCLGYSMASTVFLPVLFYCVLNHAGKKEDNNERFIFTKQ